MRATTLLRSVLGIGRTLVTRVAADGGCLLVHVRPAWRRPRCSTCGRLCSDGAVLSKGRRWRHLDLGGVETYLVYDVRRAYCRGCGELKTERVPWAAEPHVGFTDDFDLLVAQHTQRMDKTSVTRTLGIAWRTVGRCVERVMGRYGLEDPLAGLERIGIDEISYRVGHQYLTLVTDLDRGRIVWGTEGKNRAPVEAFFDELGPERTKALKVVCSDLEQGIANAIAARAPHALHVLDRFHVQRLAYEALDLTRRYEMIFRGAAAKGIRWVVLKNPESLNEAQQTKLAEIQRDNKVLFRAYLLKEQLRAILDRRQPNVVRVLLEKWCDWAERSRLNRFLPVVRSIRRHMEGILGYIRTRLSCGMVEGLNAKVRLLVRRAYGFHSAAAVIAMVRLCCSKIALPSIKREFDPAF